jgi:serine/threonine-protein kinase HipA
MKMLNVYYEQTLVGQLHENEDGLMSFQYDKGWLGANKSFPISISLPLQDESFTGNKRCKPFFENLLPEEVNREIVAKNVGANPKNPFALLYKIGGECAGALTFQPLNTKPHKSVYDKSDYLAISQVELKKYLKKLSIKPLLAGEKNMRLSLAGAQDKLVLAMFDNKIYLPLNGSPSTHIVKPEIKAYPGIAENEAFCLNLASQMGITAIKAEPVNVDGVMCLLAKRYDRQEISPYNLKRLHQEDFCQALGIVSEKKYQADGGPSLAQCFELLKKHSSLPVVDINLLLNIVIFNFLIGNNDAHGKNFSFLYTQAGIRLSPFYDLISTRIYPGLQNEMAMKIGDAYAPEYVTLKNWQEFAKSCELSMALVVGRLQSLTNLLVNKLADYQTTSPIELRVIELIRKNAKAVLSWFVK